MNDHLIQKRWISLLFLTAALLTLLAPLTPIITPSRIDPHLALLSSFIFIPYPYYPPNLTMLLLFHPHPPLASTARLRKYEFLRHTEEVMHFYYYFL